jgi:ABC-2 type transport system ATP-binding protein
VIEVTHLTKRYGQVTAVDDVSFTVQPGAVTGFLGPNGAGKSTTMRAIAGLDRPTSGSVRVNGKPFAEHAAPLTELGVLLDARQVHPGRRAENHLRALAATNGIGAARVREVIELTGLGPAAHRRVGGFSLGMSQRLGIAGALLGDPGTLILDEPINGLDPDGVIWVRHLLRYLAQEGRTILVSSHLMSEMAVTADRLIVIGKGRLLADSSIDALLEASGGTRVIVSSPEAARLAKAIAAPDVVISTLSPIELEVAGLDSTAIARIAAREGVLISELSTHSVSLEDAYLTLTQSELEYSAELPASTR